MNSKNDKQVLWPKGTIKWDDNPDPILRQKTGEKYYFEVEAIFDSETNIISYQAKKFTPS